MSNSVKAATVSYNVNKYVDSLSNTYGSGSSLCGPIVYTVSGAYSSTVTWMTYNFSSLQILFRLYSFYVFSLFKGYFRKINTFRIIHLVIIKIFSNYMSR
jgi:hypothetical protein